MLQRPLSLKDDNQQTRVIDARAALEHQRPASGDLTSETRKLLSAARRREGRFARRAPAEPMN
jgi:hypothetical protein